MGSVLVLSKNTDGVPLAHRLATEGNVVKLLFDNQSYNTVLLGAKNPTVIPSLRMLEQYDLILDTGTNSSDLVYTDGYTTLGGCPFGRRINEDEVYREKVLKLLQPNRYQNTEHPTSQNHYLLTGWFNTEFFSFWTYTITYDRLCEGDKGRIEPGMGRITKPIKPQTVLNPIIPLLQKIKYYGPVTIELHHTPTTRHITNITTTFFPIEVFELCKTKAFDMLWKLKSKEEITLRDEVAVAYKLILDTPTQDPVLSIEQAAFPHICYQDLQNDCRPADTGPTLCWVTARSQQLYEARRRALRTIRRIIKTKSIQYRYDIGVDVEPLMSEIEENASASA